MDYNVVMISVTMDHNVLYHNLRYDFYSSITGLTNEFLSEKERQTELVRMTHGEKRAQRERDFESAAILVGLGERQQTVATER